jgi:hypothetical protein
MNYPVQPGLPDDDPDLRALKKSKRAPIFITLGVLVAIPILGAAYVARGYMAVRADLEGQGYTAIELKLHGPFTFGFSGTKGTTSCSGTITRVPFSTSTQEICFDLTPKTPAAPPPPSNRESVEASLVEKYNAMLGFDHASCPEIANADTTAACTLSASNGASVVANVSRTAAGTAGDWTSWHVVLGRQVENAEKLAANTSKAVAESVKKRHPNIVIDLDCGKGPIVFTTDKKVTCTAVSEDPKPLHGTVEIVEKPDGGGLRWTETGF